MEQPLSKENSAVESLVVQLPCQTLGKVEHFTRVRFEFWSLLTNGNIGTTALADHCGAPAGGRWLALLSRGKAVELDRPPDEPIDLSTLPLLNSNSNKASHPKEAAARHRYPVAPLD
ncbi:hypothetical protein [Bradyrhizobium sp. RDM4]|uniref:hypothetical protein n=1 Tax=Bradyrhizobium sp. RDM4 TaxID=3378765 RepID=UPI0038FC65E2